MPDNPTTALVKTANSPTLARVSNQLALTEKLLAKSEEPFLIPYREGDKWGFCDRNKNVVIECLYESVEPFQNGLAVVWKYGRCGHIDKKGEEIIPIISHDITSFCFHGKYAASMRNDHWRLIDKLGNIIVENYEPDFSWTESTDSVERKYLDAGLELVHVPDTRFLGYVDKYGTEYWEDDFTMMYH
ncbi:MAG: WG repeat-containing protein [Spirosoma sp.]|nr:WG repeat-containing protein [Spirosoma sp.]